MPTYSKKGRKEWFENKLEKNKQQTNFFILMQEFINDIEMIQLAIKLGDYYDALQMLQEVKEEMLILDALNYD